jgi:hypothetical protein
VHAEAKGWGPEKSSSRGAGDGPLKAGDTGKKRRKGRGPGARSDCGPELAGVGGAAACAAWACYGRGKGGPVGWALV